MAASVNALSGYYRSYSPPVQAVSASASIDAASSAPQAEKLANSRAAKPASLLMRLYSNKSTESLPKYLSGLAGRTAGLRKAIRSAEENLSETKLSGKARSNGINNASDASGIGKTDGTGDANALSGADSSKHLSWQEMNDAAGRVKEFTAAYNDLTRYAAESSKEFNGAQKLSDELKEIVSSRRETLENAGIMLGPAGTLSVDDKKLRNMLSQDSSYLRQIFKPHDGLTDRLQAKLDEVRSKPLEYSRPEAVKRDFNAIYDRPDRKPGAAHAATRANPQAGMVVNLLA